MKAILIVALLVCSCARSTIKVERPNFSMEVETSTTRSTLGAMSVVYAGEANLTLAEGQAEAMSRMFTPYVLSGLYVNPSTAAFEAARNAEFAPPVPSQAERSAKKRSKKPSKAAAGSKKGDGR